MVDGEAEKQQQQQEGEQEGGDQKTPLFTFGAVADVQHAMGVKNVTTSSGALRNYEKSKEAFEGIVSRFKERIDDLSFVAQVGDLIDLRSAPNQVESLENMMNLISTVQPEKWFHCIGNHEINAFLRPRLSSLLDLPRMKRSSSSSLTSLTEEDEQRLKEILQPLVESNERAREFVEKLVDLDRSMDSDAHQHIDDNLFYCDFSPHPGWRCIVLDSYEIAAQGWGSRDAAVFPASIEGGQRRAFEAIHSITKDLLQHHNPIFEGEDYDRKVSPNAGVDWFAHVRGTQRIWTPINGGMGWRQMQFLAKTLDRSLALNEKVLIFTHVPLAPLCTRHDPTCVLWNNSLLTPIFQRYQGTVVAAFYGHQHTGGYAFEHSVHHIILPASLECTWPQLAYSFVSVFEDGSLDIQGFGTIPSALITPFQPSLELSQALPVFVPRL